MLLLWFWCSMNKRAKFCTLCCHFHLYMLCSCLALTNPTWPLFEKLQPNYILLYENIYSNCQWEKLFIVINVKVWLCFQKILHMFIFLLQYFLSLFFVCVLGFFWVYLCGTSIKICGHPWHFSRVLTLCFMLFSATSGTEGSLSERSTPKSAWLREKLKLHSGI